MQILGKIFIVVTCLSAITLLWTTVHISRITAWNFTEGERLISSNSGATPEASALVDEKITIGIVACGNDSLNDAITLLKSALLSSSYYGLPSLEAILFTDDEQLFKLDTKVGELKTSIKTSLKFRYEIHPVIFPAKSHGEWVKLFKPCASQRLFFNTALPHINEILYLDTDTLVVGDLRRIWSQFKQMSFQHAVALTKESESYQVSWYHRFAKHPYYPPYGLNSGVMLMNLTRLRSILQWEDAILASYNEYKDKIAFGDQDLLNIVFYHRPEIVFLLPCGFNYRTDNCMYGLNCVQSGNDEGILILHGNRKVFHDEKQNLFFILPQYFRKINLSTASFVRDIVIPFRSEAQRLDKLHDCTNTTITPNCDNIGNLFFKFVNTSLHE